MNGAALLKRPVFLVILTALLFLIALKLDFLGGNIPQSVILSPFFRFFNFLGNGAFLLGVSLLLYIYGAYKGGTDAKKAAANGALSVLIGGIVVQILKMVFERPRPSFAGSGVLTQLDSPALFDVAGRFNSFPSGHTVAAFAFAYAMGKACPRLRPFLYTAAGLIGLARIYLGSHYPTDVAAGAVVGLLAGWFAVEAINARGQRLLALFLFLTVFISFFKSGGVLLFDVDEAVFSEASREMIETGDFITPTYNYEPRFDKPILIYWLMAASFKLFGTNEFAARFTSGLFGVLLAAMTFFFIRRVKGSILPALLTGAALLLNIEYFVYTHSAVTDITTAFFIAAAIYSFYLSISEENPKWMAAFWAASAFATLTKGAIGIVFPVVIAFLYLLAAKETSRWKTVLGPAHIVLFLVISMPWYAAEFYVNGWDFFNAFIVKHHLKRFSGVISSHGGPFYYYILVLIAAYFPWVAFLPAGLWRGIKDMRGRSGGLVLLAAIWFIFVFVFFSAASTKLPNYIFPLIPAASILSGLSMHEFAGQKEPGTGSGINILIILSVVFASAFILLPSIGLKADVALPPLFFYIIGAAFLLMGLLALAAYVKPLISIAGISAVMVALLVFLRLQAVPPVNIYLQKDLYVYATYAKRLASRTVFAA
ncbi:MAG: phosphatase PAP2 family protein [Deltaproteobacteria bacterium]|nr:phosphatase PAP2 family protein [Deltaproteobacteria bacterium]